MDINDCLAVRLTSLDDSGVEREWPVIASGLLAWEDFPESEWNRHLPWRFLDLADALPPGAGTAVQICLDVEERASRRCRRVVTRSLGASRATFSWDDVSGAPGSFEVILDLGEPGRAAQVARLEVESGEVALESHVRIRGDHIEDLLGG
ncbi:MAG: hypothetical protein ACKO3G_15935 [Planctomycetaceae bacterium]